MSKKSREERRKVAEERRGPELKAGNASAVAPPPPKDPMVQYQPGADPKVIEQRPIWLTRKELVDLIKVVEHHRTTHPLLPYLKQVRDGLDDHLRQLKELEAVAIANGFWLEGEQANLNGIIGKMKRGRAKGEREANPKKGHRKLESLIACPTVEEAKAAVAEMEAERNGHAKEQ